MDGLLLRRVFSLLNRFFMVPVFRMGLGAFMGSPLTGYIMLVKTIGRKTGKVRYTPVNYAIRDGNVYCLSGWGERALWYRNLQAHPTVELILPSGPLAGITETTPVSADSLPLLRQILKNAGFAGFFVGCNPFTASDELLLKKSAAATIVRIRPTGLGSGAADPGGWLWVVVTLIILWLLLV